VQHFRRISAARSPHWPWDWPCSGSLHVGAKNNRGRTLPPGALETRDRDSRAASSHEVGSEILWRKEGNEAPAPAWCSFRECSTSCGCAAGWWGCALSWIPSAWMYAETAASRVCPSIRTDHGGQGNSSELTMCLTRRKSQGGADGS